MTSRALAERVIDLAQDKKGQQIVLMDISRLTTIADFFVIVSGDSNVQIKAIADHITDELLNEGIRIYHKEGYEYQNWILLDYSDVIVHILKKDIRKYYALEKLWADAKMSFITETV
ncbi:MAG: ribosome silencing factor [Calditrichaceae bacterium]|nr:ribosome silencing factor [Calditrichaceae bacterium]MBN2707904.1 ribosome silencing factor [Calditrichaceae bacterium]RQV97850.1 MAG: ribosome silencing factor [Calditrichota bacterium]